MPLLDRLPPCQIPRARLPRFRRQLMLLRPLRDAGRWPIAALCVAGAVQALVPAATAYADTAGR